MQNISSPSQIIYFDIFVLILLLFHIFLFVGLPIYLQGFQNWLIAFACFSLTAGLVLSIVFQLAHTVEDTSFPVANQPENKMPDEFAAHQILTTANFATKSKIVSWLVGGLNFQIEHHLFPKISHIHYPVISNIVKATCQDFNVKYIEYPKMKLAIHAHVNHLRNMGIKK